MRIAKNTAVTLTEAPTSRFLLVVDVMDGAVTVEKSGSPMLSLSLDGTAVRAALFYPDGRCAELFGASAKGREVILTAGYARVGLYVDGVLLDEDFFFTPLDYKDATLKAGSFSHFEAGYEYHAASESAIVENLTDTLDGYAPIGTEYAVLRPLPHVIGDRLHLLYLDDRHGGTAKDGRGAHKLCAMFSDDGKTFHGAPIALAIDNVREDDIEDAALLFHEGRYYLYYLVKYATHRALSCAVSEDGFSFLKTGLDIEISGMNCGEVSAIAVKNAPTPRLYFVKDGKAYFAESIDLLHFSTPTEIKTPTPMDKVIPAGDTLFFQKDGTLFRLSGDTLTPLENAPPFAYPVFYKGEMTDIGVRNGAFAQS